MKLKTILLLTILTLLFSVPCYAEAPGAITAWFVIFLLMVISCGLILGCLVKVVLFYARIESAKNWQIFLASMIAAGLLLYVLFRGT